ncbi:alpha-galactosidase [Buchananella hordeovulneris]|uniref:alpha-galactosidase n=1 Tax=Buchananella hordeovulneris TaxID=52770 RepID=UPI0026DD0F82|nr:alpha-galactosidase [Buchananella hordeovulneris]MDO5081674.1 alpha-galactosidase [Buchananella hordeovulneris]
MRLTPGDTSIIYLRNAGTCLLLDLSTLTITHWGPDLGSAQTATLTSLARAARLQRVSGGLDETAPHSLVATPATGWLGTPTLEGHRDGGHVSARFTLVGGHYDATTATLHLTDPEAELALAVDLTIGAGGLVGQRLTLTNTGTTPYAVARLEPGLPLPWHATEILDTTGRHLRERSPQRHHLTYGTYERTSRRGRPGADATVLLAAGQPGFGFTHGRVYGAHVAWSGNHRLYVERTTTGQSFLAGGALYLQGEVCLAPGQQLTTPWLYASWGEGLNALAARFHTEWRARPAHPRRPRPVTLNTWEAVYFAHDLARLTALADAAAEVGVERFVLDDGWFLHRRDDTAGLGDWYVDPAVWPMGLGPLIEHVRERGMEFGLWVEPEMVNPDSDLARAHPDWVLQARTTLPPVARQQQVLNLTLPAVADYLFARLDALLVAYPISYLKWDHNRDLVEAASGPGGQHLAQAQTLALYELLDRLKAKHPHLEIESCASGGARVDLGILARTDRVWTSDCLDPLERLPIQAYTGLVVPPEMLGTHLTSPRVHSTGRTVDLRLAGAVALFGHFGIEWDLTTLSATERQAVADWVALAKRVRPLVASGALVHADTADPALDVRGVVAADQSQAFFAFTQVATSVSAPPGRVRLPGLAAQRTYRLTVASPGGWRQEPAQSPLAWATDDICLTGAQLAEVGLRPPVQYPQQATVIELTAM